MTTMMIVEEPSRFGAPKVAFNPTPWESFGANVYVCRVLICPKEAGGYYAQMLRLPSVSSEGEAISAVVEDIRQVFREQVLECRCAGREIPWMDTEIGRPLESIVQHILVNVQDLEDRDDVSAIEEARQESEPLPYDRLREDLGLS
jgi:hypothetical protein